jgi:hypothetical protein
MAPVTAKFNHAQMVYVSAYPTVAIQKQQNV